jgi:hypothetical protein
MLMVLNGHDLISPIDVSSLRSQQVMGFWYVGGRKEWSIEVSQPTTTREKLFPEVRCKFCILIIIYMSAYCFSTA